MILNGKTKVERSNKSLDDVGFPEQMPTHHFSSMAGHPRKWPSANYKSLMPAELLLLLVENRRQLSPVIFLLDTLAKIQDQDTHSKSHSDGPIVDLSGKSVTSHCCH